MFRDDSWIKDTMVDTKSEGIMERNLRILRWGIECDWGIGYETLIWNLIEIWSEMMKSGCILEIIDCDSCWIDGEYGSKSGVELEGVMIRSSVLLLMWVGKLTSWMNDLSERIVERWWEDGVVLLVGILKSPRIIVLGDLEESSRKRRSVKKSCTFELGGR